MNLNSQAATRERTANMSGITSNFASSLQYVGLWHPSTDEILEMLYSTE